MGKNQKKTTQGSQWKVKKKAGASVFQPLLLPVFLISKSSSPESTRKSLLIPCGLIGLEPYSPAHHLFEFVPMCVLCSKCADSYRALNMVVRDSSPLPSSDPIEQKGSRNKRKLKEDSAICSHLDALTVPSDFDSSSPNSPMKSTDSEQEENACGMCGRAELDHLRYADWSDITECQLEEILMGNLDDAYRTAIKIVSLSVHNKDIAKEAVLRSRTCYGKKDMVSNIVDGALEFLRSVQGESYIQRDKAEEDLKKLEKKVLVDMIGVLRRVRVFFNVGDVLWWLLMSDGNIYQPFSVNKSLSSNLGTNEIAGNSTASQSETNNGSNQNASAVCLDANIAGPKKKNVYVKHNEDMSSSIGASSLHHGRCLASSNSQGVEESSWSTSAQSEEITISARKVHGCSSRRESILRHFEKSCHALGSKAISRAKKHDGLGDLVKCKTILETSSRNLSSSMKQPRAGGLEKILADGKFSLPDDFVYTSISSCCTNSVSRKSPAPVANSELALSLPTTSRIGIDATQNSKSVSANFSDYAAFSTDKIKDWVPEDKDEIFLLLLSIVDELKEQRQDWSDWIQKKIMQTRFRLLRNKAELETLKKEKDELQKERQLLEENTIKKLAEMEGALMKASGQVGDTNAAANRLQLENDRLRIGLEVAKLHAAESSATCQKISERERMTSKTLHSLDKEKTLFQEELLTKKGQLSKLQKQFEQMEENQAQTKAKWRQEEKLKNEALAEANKERNRREQYEASIKSLEAKMTVNSENDLQRRKAEIRRLQQQIELLRRVVQDSSTRTLAETAASHLSDQRKTFNGQLLTKIFDSLDLEEEDIQFKQECVMCISEEASVVFLPCAHQVLCTSCNELHLNKGMQDCPTCRIPIKQRIFVRWADS